MRESYIEKKFKDACKAEGMKSVKFTGEIGMPDRLVLFKGFAGFAELKAPGKDLRKSQELYLLKLKDLGCFGRKVDSIQDIALWIEEFKNHIKSKGC